MERPDNCSDKIYEIMQQCWEHRPSKRPSFFKIIRVLLEHVHTDSEGYLSRFREVSYYFSNEGTQEREKERTGMFTVYAFVILRIYQDCLRYIIMYIAHI